jgi:hypothetical protein
MYLCLPDTTEKSLGWLRQEYFSASIWLFAEAGFGQKSRLANPSVACVVYGGIYIYRGIPRDENDVYGYHDERKLTSYAMSYPVSIMTYNDFGYPTGYHTLLGITSLPLRLPAIVAFGLGGSQYSIGAVRSQFMTYFLLVLGRHMSVVLSVMSVAVVFWIGVLLFRNFFWAIALAFAYCVDPCNVFSSYIFKP